MALVLETGVGVGNANSYVSIDEFKSYSNDRGYDIPADDGNVSSLLIRATDIIDTSGTGTGDTSFVGCKHSSTQGLQFPRSSILFIIDGDKEAIFVALKKAVCEMAFYFHKNNIVSNLDYSNSISEFATESKLDGLGVVKKERLFSSTINGLPKTIYSIINFLYEVKNDEIRLAR